MHPVSEYLDVFDSSSSKKSGQFLKTLPIVQKYGGTSLGDIEHMRQAALRIFDRQAKGVKVVVTVSAMGATTDHLMSMAHCVTHSPNLRELDALLSTGEQQACALLTLFLQNLGIRACSLTGQQAGLLTNSCFGNASILHIDTRHIYEALAANEVVVVAGYQGADSKGNITTLGRGGSDTTAVTLAAALGCAEAEIFTDVDGIYTADPRVVPNALKHVSLEYDDMLHLASLGASVLHPQSVLLAQRHNISIRVRSSFNTGLGTVVENHKSLTKTGTEHTWSLVGIAVINDLVSIEVIFAGTKVASFDDMYATLQHADIKAELFTSTLTSKGILEEGISPNIVIHRSTLNLVLRLLKPVVLETGTHIILKRNISKLSVVGDMTTSSSMLNRVFKAVTDTGAWIDAATVTGRQVSIIIPTKLSKISSMSLHDALILS